jgi:hypothetical protein
MHYLKRPTFRSESWRRAVSELPCSMCLREGPSQAAHANHIGKGMGMKAPDCFVMPLCPDCHREFDQGHRFSREEKREMAERWVLLTIQRLAEDGRITIK